MNKITKTYKLSPATLTLIEKLYEGKFKKSRAQIIEHAILELSQKQFGDAETAAVLLESKFEPELKVETELEPQPEPEPELEFESKYSNLISLNQRIEAEKMYLEGKSISEIMEHIKVSHKTIRSLLARKFGHIKFCGGCNKETFYLEQQKPLGAYFCIECGKIEPHQ